MKDDPKNEKNKILSAKIDDESYNELEEKLSPFFNMEEADLLKKIIDYNQVDKLLLKGEYRPVQGKSFGFFTNVRHENENKLFYPFINTSIAEIFIPPNRLIEGFTYTFEVIIAKDHERNSKFNPFLLEAKTENIKEVIRHSQLTEEILKRRKELNLLEKQIEESEYELEKRTKEIDKQIERYLQDKENEANIIIEQYNQTLIEKFQEIEYNEVLITQMNDQISDIKTQLTDYLNKKNEMETTINFLRNKIEVCKNLEFLSEQDAEQYIELLGTKQFLPGEKYLDFEKDLSAEFPRLVTHIKNYLYYAKNLIYTEFQIKNFLTLLMTNDLIVLSGLSGSGKTQIVKAFAEVLGGVAKIIPIKPNWTSSDDLLGYYNPIQSSFLPTPFTEAIVEAIQNPDQIYLICLDEMNLARVEYYFADFLSKLEERNEQPEIELYAKHEEELFISEFKTFLTLIESAIGENKITSWQEFLETDSIRTRFFELLGNSENETLLQIHSKMKRRLLDIIKFPSSIKIPNNIRFIGAINVDETTHYFSPKILDRIHVVKFENPLLVEDVVSSRIESSNNTVLKPIYLKPDFLGQREELPPIGDFDYGYLTERLKEINKSFLLPLSIDFGVRSIRQCINFAKIFDKVSFFDFDDDLRLNRAISTNAVIIQKILPRFIFDGNEKLKNGDQKLELLDTFALYVEDELSPIYEQVLDNYEVGILSDEYLRNMVSYAKLNNGQINFYA